MMCLGGKIQLNKSFSNSALSPYCEHFLLCMGGNAVLMLCLQE